MEHLCHRPQYTQHQQDTHKWWQMSDGLEDRHEYQSAHTQQEDYLTLVLGKGCHLIYFQVLLLVKLTLERQTQDSSRNNHRHQRGHENLCEHTLGRNHTLDPQHDGGHVTNRREGTTRVGRDDNQTSVNQAFLATLDQLSQHHNHHNTCGQVVEDGREEERHKGHTPHQLALRACLHHVAYEVETSVRVHNLDNGHSTHQEKQRLASVAQMVLNATRNKAHAIGHLREESLYAHHQQRPAAHTHQQGNGCLVNLQHALQGYAQIANNKERNNHHC